MSESVLLGCVESAPIDLKGFHIPGDKLDVYSNGVQVELYSVDLDASICVDIERVGELVGLLQQALKEAGNGSDV